MAPIWEWIAEVGDVRVGVTTSRRDQTTSTVIVAGRQVLLVDPAWDPDELAAIAADLADRDLTVVAGFATHAHHDHLLWHPGLGEVPRWASASTARRAHSRRRELLEALDPWPTDLADLVGTVTAAPPGRVPWDGPEVLMITHDAHAAGHTALWLPAEHVLVAGDMLSDVELPLLEESSTADYRRGLHALQQLVARAEVVIPGHGAIAIGTKAATARWRADHTYLNELTSEVASSDARLDNPGMAQAHRANLLRARPVHTEQ